MQHPIDYSFALNQLARAQASILLTQADDLSDCLAEYIKRGLKDMPPDYLMAAHEEHQLLARRTHEESPSRPGMYLNYYMVDAASVRVWVTGEQMVHGLDHSNGFIAHTCPR